MKLAFITIDVFTRTRYEGNPLAIVQVPANHDGALTQAKKQRIAREFNLSETVFLHLPRSSSDEPIKIDIFTPDAELPFAGHPTIGSAWYLLHHQNLSITTILTKAGPIPITQQLNNHVRATLPHNIHIHTQTVPSPHPTTTVHHPIISIVKGVSFILVPLPSLAALSHATTTLHPDPYETSILDPGWQEGLIGTLYYAPNTADDNDGASTGTAYRTRMHINFEDPATGSASGALAAYLALREPAARGAGPFRYVLTQGVEMGRRSVIGVEVLRRERDGAGAGAGAGAGKGMGDVGAEWEVESVFLSGEAVELMEGALEA
jgi:PhzF family phenazine biosynthesis protein